ncbi:DUF2809 domain-containing protein [Arthrobacter crystallopoietes]|uniref:DUF2809 domain-containing protein n=1 Tax=Crystallibacter crystallopoietes TaxID=37928 RepID=A0A1H1ENX4_9MICC|nr:DUF2809 domain-containing protein [Arthrobacter crystallopoietes]SDQ89806.1 Protein of unknown function [Arthrobacter crystallopoietes]
MGSGTWTNHTGDALYAVLIYLLVAAVASRNPSVLISAAALAVCTAVELLQLSPLPAALGEIFPPARLVFGTTFGMLDLVSYATGVLAAGLLDGVLRRRLGAPRSGRRIHSGAVSAEASARTCRR